MKNLIILRGLPGAGKTTVAELFGTAMDVPVFSADHYFEKEVDGKIVYKFDVTKLGAAHAECMRKTEQAIKEEQPFIFVANTFTMEKEINPYKKLAEDNGYAFFSLIVENRHGNTTIHRVPEEKLQEMRNRFVIQL